jgi:sulfocyanin
MRRTVRISSALALALAATACGEKKTEEAAAPPATAPAATAPAGPSTDWLKADAAAKTATLDVVAGKDASNNNWNFNGFANGSATVTVPTGYKVTINFSNNDPNMAHSIGVVAKATPFSATPDTKPVFAGAISKNPNSMTDATKKGDMDTVTFTADKPGEYAVLCFVPGHAAAGMWINFTVADGATAGVMAGGAMGGSMGGSMGPAATGASGSTGN